MNSRLLIFFCLTLVAHEVSFADDESTGWLWSVACPESGTSPEFPFSVTTSGGFTGSGRCKRTNTKFSKFIFDSYSGGTPHTSTVYGVHTGEVLIMPPVLTIETKPVFLVDSKCPESNKTLNWIFSQWSPSERHTLTSYNVMGSGAYNTSTGVSVAKVYDVEGTTMFSGSIGLSGTCSNGAYVLSGSGDRGGTIYFSRNGAGNMKAASGKATLFLPAHTISAATDLGSIIVPGLYFDSTAVSSSIQVRVTTNGAGTTWTVEPYSNVETGDISSAFSDSISITQVNSPENGMLRGTLTRTGTGSGTGKIACIMTKGVATRIVCSAELPADNTVPISLAFAIEGPRVLGQPSGTSYEPLELGMRNPSASTKNGKLFVADSNNHRVLIWNSIPTSLSVAADVVLGQPNLGTNVANNGGRSAKTLNYPTFVYSDGTKLFVSDTTNNRVLIWNAIPTTNQVSANVVLGQPDMVSATANNGGVAANRLSAPGGIFSDGTKLFVADSSNNRVLIWNAIPTTNQVSADVVLGQPNMTSATANNGGIAANKLSGPLGVMHDGTKLFVADSTNNRVLIWNAIPTTNQVSANVVLGQPNMTSATANNGGRNGKTLSAPSNVQYLGTKLFVADSSNSRILIWNTIPTANQVSADLVLGQPSTTAGTINNGGIGGNTLYYPYSVHADGTKLVVADRTNHRVLVWNTIPTANQVSANVVLGQPDTISNQYNNGGLTAKVFAFPNAVHISGTKLFVADTYNNRVLIWNSVPTVNQVSADVVLGQPDMLSKTYNSGGLSGQSLAGPRSVHSDGTKLFVADTENNRVLIWNAIPTTNQASANVVIGQPDTLTSDYNSPSISGKTLYWPTAVYSNGTKLFVADLYNNRVLIWNTIPTTNQVSANVVLGQPNTTSDTSNNGGINGKTMFEPYGVHTNGTKLFVADTQNNRVLIWNTIPTANQVSANVVLGQPNTTSSTENNSGISDKTFFGPFGVVSDGTKLFVSDSTNHRVLIWNTIPTANQVSANVVLGQPNMTSNTENSGGMTSKTVYFPFGISVSGNRLFVADQGNSRILTLELP